MKSTYFNLTIVGAIQFVVFIGIAMMLYGGGIYTDPTTKGYSFFYNFISDLGRYRLYNGNSNFVCMAFFSFSLAFSALTFLPFFYSWQQLLTKNATVKLLARVGCGAGIISGLSYMVVAVTPWDKFFVPHVSCVYAGFIGILIASIFFSSAMFLEKNYPKLGAIAMTLFGFLAFSYLLLLFFGPSYKTQMGLKIQVVGQKVIVFSQVIVLLLQAFIAKRYIKKSLPKAIK
jgi:hypothetical protein